jgi:WD40 repeat protein
MMTRRVLAVSVLVLAAALLGLWGYFRPDAKPQQDRLPGQRASFDGQTGPSRLVFSPDGRSLAVGSEKEDVRVWDVESEKELFRLAGTACVAGLVFSPDGRALATACAEPVIRFWDARTGREKASFRGDIGKVKLLALSPDGATLASWSEQDDWNARVLLWDVPSGKQKEPLKSSADTAGLRRAHLAARSRRPTGRARTGRPSRKRTNSSARAAALA